MSMKLEQAIASAGVAVTAVQAGAPEIVVGHEASARAHCAKEKKSPDDATLSGGESYARRSLRFSFAAAAYFSVGILGWYLCELASPHILTLQTPGFGFAQKTPESTDLLLQATQKMTSELQALQGRIEAMNATRAKGDAGAVNVDEMNRRIDAAKAETGAQIRQLASTVEQLQRDMNARLSEIAAASRPAERPEPPRLTTAVRIEEGHRRSRRFRGDAFDPSMHPDAPGAPRQLRAYPR